MTNAFCLHYKKYSIRKHQALDATAIFSKEQTLQKGSRMTEIFSSKKIFTKIHKAIPPHVFDDPVHDFSHSLRVAHNCIQIEAKERSSFGKNGDPEILLAAALLHDIGNVEKNHPKAHLSSQFSAEQAEIILRSVGFPSEKIDETLDAILCHSFSAGLTPQTYNGKIFQDADRLDGLGAIGIARLFATGARFNALLYSRNDPFLEHGRTPNDKDYMVDHFFVKIFRIPEKMQTKTGKLMARERVAVMKAYLNTLKNEIGI